jgi:hypothetical protein
MYTDINTLYEELKAKGTKTNIETYGTDINEQIEKLNGEAKTLMQLVRNIHPDYVNDHYYYQGNPRYDRVNNIAANDKFWDNDDAMALWDGILPNRWEKEIITAWPLMTSWGRMEIFQYMPTNWLFNEVDLIDLVEYISYHNSFLTPLASCLLLRLNANDAPFVQKVKDILQNNSEVGTVNELLIQIIVKSERPELWEELRKLLLAAQRQEGLRQSIINNINLGKGESRMLFIETIIENELLRFTSVLKKLEDWIYLPLAEGKLSGEKDYEKLGQLILSIYKKGGLTSDIILNNKNLVEAYFQLWVLREINAKLFWEIAEVIMASKDETKKAILLYTTSVLGLKGFLFAKRFCRQEKDLIVRWNIWKSFTRVYGDEPYDKDDGAFEFFEGLMKDIPTEELKNPKPMFAWEDYNFIIRDLSIHWIYRVAKATNRFIEILPYEDRLPNQERGGLMHWHFEKITNPYGLPILKNTPFEPTEFERNWVVRNIQDKVAYVYNIAFTLYLKLSPLQEELPTLYGLLTRKSDDIRKNILSMLSKLSDSDLKTSIDFLVNAKSEEQRLAGLDLLQQLKKQNRLTSFVEQSAKAFSERKKIATKEELILHDLLAQNVEVYDEKNGYGLYDPSKRIAMPTIEKPTSGFFVEKMYGKPMFGLSMSLEKLHEELKKLDALITENENYEYEVIDYSNIKRTVLIGQNYSIQSTKYFQQPASFDEVVAALPLSHIWLDWYKNSGLTALDLYIMLNFTSNFGYEAKFVGQWLIDLITKYTHQIYFPIVNENTLKLKYPNHINGLLYTLRNDQSIQELITSIELDLTTHYFASIPQEYMNVKYHGHAGNTEPNQSWRELFAANYSSFQNWDYAPYGETKAKVEDMSDEQFKQFWSTHYWFFRQVDKQNNMGYASPSVYSVCRAHELGLIDDNEVHYMALETSIWSMIANDPTLVHKQLFEKYPVIKNFLDKAIPHILELELKRGETPTTVTKFTTLITEIKGLSNFIKIIKGLGKDTLQRGYSYGQESKSSLFSRFLKCCKPLENETFDDFKKALDQMKLSEARLLQFSLYAPQWMPWTEQYLGWQGLQSAAWCLHAHAHAYFDLQKESELAKYTTISAKDFQDGAVDVSWYKEAYSLLGEERFQEVYEAAHYICDNQGYIRARVYVDAVLGKFTLEECKSRITNKRNKDYVVAIGLLPLAEKLKDADILDRYKFLQAFKKQSKDFGQQRQASEKRVVELAMDNLARNAGYPDPIRLTWAMETMEVEALMKNVKAIQIENTTIELSVSNLGKAEVIAIKNGKQLANVPPALKKNEEVANLIEIKNNLNAQQARIKKSLEEAMIRGDVIERKEIEILQAHPIINKLFNALIWIGDKGDPDFYDLLPKQKTYRIAHCSDLFSSGRWSIFQQAIFKQQLIQPFKQVFRELYTPSQDELAAVGESRRYEGYKIQPSQAGALFRARGWAANYYEGVQKVFHKEKIRVNVEVYADWFNPQNSEPTEIHAIRFYKKHNGEALALKEVPEPLFSEVMRDLDLVVSVAHVGGVDIEASLSSMELRAAIVEETASIFGLDNVTIEKNHIFIKGQRGEYTIHLGSGIVHQKLSRMLNIEAVSTQGRGRIFLPFADEDPKTAEIVSKVLLLAKDEKIMDEGILNQMKN